MATSARWINVVAIASAIAAGGLSGAASRLQAPRGHDAPPPAATATEGQAITALPDGTYLLTGGISRGMPSASMTVQDPRDATMRTLRETLVVPRAWHTATLLPDGRVLIRGGVGADGLVVHDTEILDLGTRRLSTVEHPVLFHRSHHTSTVLSDGRVLTIGGRGEGGALLVDAEVWDPASGESLVVAGSLRSPRAGHSAAVRADGRVRVSGGRGSASAAAGDELFDPERQTFAEAEQHDEAAAEPSIAAASPTDGSVDVPSDVTIALRFSTPMAAASLSPRTIVLRGGDRGVPIRAVPVEHGRLVFVSPLARLTHEAEYVLSIDGALDARGRALPATELRFTTSPAPGEPAATDAGDEAWVPTAGNLRGEWRSGRADSPWRQLPPLQAAAGVTAVAGQVLLLNGRPLADVTLSVGQRTTRSDRTGRFLLERLTPGRHVLRIDGRTASRPQRAFGLFDAAIYVRAGRTNVLSYAVWMPLLDTRNAVSIPSPTTAEVVVTTPHIPGLELRIPPGTVVRDVEGRPVESVSITPIPVDRPPFPLPAGVQVPIYFTIQPGGASLASSATPWPAGARLIYPNYRLQPAGRRIDFWQYDPEAKGWFVYGRGTVTGDRRQIVPDARVSLYQFTGAMVADPSVAPPEGREPGDVDTDGDPVDLSTGQFVLEQTDLVVPDTIPIVIKRTYRPQDSASRAFGIGGTLEYDMLMFGDTFPYTFQTLALADGGRIRFDRISPGTGFEDAVYEHVGTPSRFYKATLRWNGTADLARAWRLTLKDGTTFFFPEAEDQTNPYRAALTAIADRNGHELVISRNDSGQIVSILSPNGRWLSLTYDASGRITRIEDVAGREVVYTYDAGGRLWKVTDPAGGVTEYAYDAANRHFTTKDPRGQIFVTNEYDADNRMARQTMAGGGVYEFDYTLDAAGKVVQTDVTNPRGFVRRLTFNADGYTLTDTRAVGRPEAQATTYVRQAGTNLVLSSTDALNRKTAYAYDSLGNVTSITKLADTADAVATTFTFGPAFSTLTSVTDPLDQVTSIDYDAQGNATAITHPDGHETTYAYNAAGQAVSMTTHSGTTLFGFDGADVVSVTDPLGRVSTRTYDSIGRLLRLANPLGHSTQYEYDGRGDVTKVIDALGGEMILAYDPGGNLSTVTDARDNTTTYTWDGLNRMATRTDPLLRVESFVYDTLGDLQQVTDRKSQVTTYTYDALGRVLTATYHDGSSTSYTYDVVGRLTQVVDSIGGTITRTYDALDRLTSETTPEGTVTYTYDAANRRSTMTAAGQPAVSYTYDDANRVTGITQGSATVGLDYDDDGRRSLLTLPNGLSVEYTYDAASQLTALSYRLGGTPVGNLTYEYDASGRRTLVGGTWARTSLPAAVASATYDAANQLQTWGGSAFGYDANGSVTSDGSKVYTWNARNQLTGVTGASPATFQYDGLDRRRSRNVGGIETAFQYDRENVVQELVGGTPAAFVVSGLDLDQWFTRTDAAGTHAFLADALGSTLALADSTGTVETEYTYGPFGATTVTGAPNGNPFQFTGRENDGTGVYYYRMRFYDPSSSRFLSEDPLQWAGGSPSFFTYVNNDPLNLVDPTGLGWWSCMKCFLKSYGDCSKSSKECEKELAKKYPNPIDLCFSRNPPYTSPAAAAVDICFFQNPACQKAWADCTACAADPIRPRPPR